MGKNLTIPKRGDLVVCIRYGFIAGNDRAGIVREGEMGMVTFTRNSDVGHLHITWFNGTKSKHYLNGKWARHAAGWKQWMRVVEHKT